MTELIAWLRATIEGDLAKARDVVQPDDQWYTARDLFEEAPCVDWDEGEFLTLYTPGVVIARCEAELAEIDAIMAMPHYAWDGRSEYGCPMLDPDAYAGPVCTCGRDAIVNRLLRIKASGYRHRPGWQEGWAP
ncbi:hypothetical protein IMZ11_02520 [Microtetraspora sp. AC03309]|uniref:DUF6221 family protein n=1 Tax=Microtetraspora sp. AC03309 TaxID=2779376 RepID=UPI001E35D305|nr:DUF6221 family protein [Microtetraspora sp. AC03309]MCC5574513.1 hypothetical protein [Microtetraspora sp. AC03309]